MSANTNSWLTGEVSKSVSFKPTDIFQRVAVTYTIPDNADTFANKEIWFAIHGNYQSDLYIRNLKLERGTMATDWTPAPEDTDAKITEVVLCQEKVQIKNDFFHLASTLAGKLLLQL